MKEFGVFPVEMNAGGKRTKFPADQLVDKAMETIVANAINFRKQHGLQRNDDNTTSAEPKRQVLFPCLKVRHFLCSIIVKIFIGFYYFLFHTNLFYFKFYSYICLRQYQEETDGLVSTSVLQPNAFLRHTGI